VNDYDFDTGIAVDIVRNVYVTGESDGIEMVWDCTTIKYNSVVQQEWVSRYNGPANDNDWGTGIALDKSDNVYVTGGSVVAGIFSEYITMKYNSAGQQQWVAHYHGTGNGNDTATALALDSSGNTYVTGSSFNSNNNFDCVTIKYDPAGQETWVARYDGPIHLDDLGYAIAIDNSSNVSVTGAGQVSFSEFNYLTIRYNSAGQEQWVAQSEAGGYAAAVATDSSGNTYITGTGGVTTPDYATIKYDALGQEQWLAQYNGPGNGADNANAIAVDGSGNVYVTGTSLTSEPFNSDCATIKYVQGPTPTATPTSTPIACALFENFDLVTPPALPAGWTASNAIDPDGVLWQTSDSGNPIPPADSPPNAAWVNDPPLVSDKRLDSLPIAIDTLENAALTFRNNYALQNTFDGGVLEISIDGGAFQDIIAAGGSFLQGGYDGTISACCGNPLAGRQAWTGSSGSFITTTVDMVGFQGHTIVLRWRMGSDSSTSGQGWRLDNVQMICERPTPTATPTASATVSPTPTASPTPSEPSMTPSPTPSATFTPTSTPTTTPPPTPTATPTLPPTPRVTPTPRLRPTPARRP